MKIRILGNSLRLRLSQSEVQQFAEKNLVQSQIEFGLDEGESIIYALKKGAFNSISASFKQNQVHILVPEEIGKNWIETSEIGIRNEMPLGEGKFLKILIEKDFKCLTVREGEDETDNYPHPKEGMINC